jgi:hypothetical protein
MRAPLFVLCACGLAACAPTVQTVSLRLDANVDDAEVVIDDESLGPVARVEKRGVALPVGKHRLSIERAGYFPFDAEIEAKPGQDRIELEVTLEKIPD